MLWLPEVNCDTLIRRKFSIEYLHIHEKFDITVDYFDMKTKRQHVIEIIMLLSW